MGYSRSLNLLQLIDKKSFFLFGPRSTGKSTLIREQLKGRAQVIDLLNSEIRLRLLNRPADLEYLVQAPVVVIDEIQKIPELLDEVHRLIEEKKIRFLLTGSSARKIRREAQGNLLGGRARIAHLFPLTYDEIQSAKTSDEKFNLERYLATGGLPSIYGSVEPWEDLIAYVDGYLREEIQQEAQVRQIGNFSRFLKTAAMQNGQLLNYAGVASDAGVPESTVRGYYQILQDTLLGDCLEPWVGSKKRKAIQTAKFFFFDPGVTHALLNMRSLERATDQYGRAFEQWIYMELRACIAYRRLHQSLHFWRSVNGQEVDFIVGEDTAIEVKATTRISARNLSGIRALREERKMKKFILVSHDPLIQTIDGVECLSWQEFISQLWTGKIVS